MSLPLNSLTSPDSLEQLVQLDPKLGDTSQGPTCISQRQCLDPGLVFDHVDCVSRKSCDSQFDGQFQRDSNTPVAPSVISNASGTFDVAHTPSFYVPSNEFAVHAVPSAMQSNDIMPVHVFSTILAICATLIFLAVLVFIVRGRGRVVIKRK